VGDYLRPPTAEPVDVELVEAFWRIGWLDPEELEDVATRLLTEGKDSHALVSLAAAIASDRNDVSKLFDQALYEIGHEAASENESGARVARHVASKIVSGDLAPEDGVAAMAMICVDLATPSADSPGYVDYPESLMWFCNTEDDISDRGGVCPEEWKAEIIQRANKLLESTS